jgi:hypothetical protein
VDTVKDIRQAAGRHLRARAAVFGGICGLLLGVLALAVPSAGTGQVLSRCPAAQLRISRLDVQGAAGHRYWDLALRNVGPASCRMRGYPGVGLLDAHGRLLAVNVSRVSGFPRPTVTVAPGRSAYFSFGYTTGGPCIPHTFNAFAIEVYPPDDYSHLLFDARGAFNVCDTSVGGSPVVYPIRASRRLG